MVWSSGEGFGLKKANLLRMGKKKFSLSLSANSSARTLSNPKLSTKYSLNSSRLTRLMATSKITISKLTPYSLAKSVTIL